MHSWVKFFELFWIKLVFNEIVSMFFFLICKRFFFILINLLFMFYFQPNEFDWLIDWLTDWISYIAYWLKFFELFWIKLIFIDVFFFTLQTIFVFYFDFTKSICRLNFFILSSEYILKYPWSFLLIYCTAEILWSK